MLTLGAGATPRLRLLRLLLLRSLSFETITVSRSRALSVARIRQLLFVMRAGPG